MNVAITLTRIPDNDGEVTFARTGTQQRRNGADLTVAFTSYSTLECQYLDSDFEVCS